MQSKPKITYKCSSCNANHSSWKGKCHFCSSWNTINEFELPAKKYSIPKASPKRKEQNKKPDNHMEELDKWFEERIAEAKNNPVCEECGCSVANQLNSKDTWVKRSGIAHIFPKRLRGGFPSVSCHELNWVLLCIDHHAEMDSSWEKATKMKVWPEVVKKALMFSHLIVESHSKLPEELFED